MNNKVTLKNVADYVGVSTATVSYVLNGKQQSISDETKEAILNAVKELGYYPNMNAKELASNRSQLIGVVVPQKATTRVCSQTVFTEKSSAA